MDLDRAKPCWQCMGNKMVLCTSVFIYGKIFQTQSLPSPSLEYFPLWTTYHCKAPQMPELLYENLPMHFPWWVATTVYSTSKCQGRSQHFLLEGSKFSRSLLSTNTNSPAGKQTATIYNRRHPVYDSN